MLEILADFHCQSGGAIYVHGNIKGLLGLGKGALSPRPDTVDGCGGNTDSVNGQLVAVQKNSVFLRSKFLFSCLDC